MHANTIATYYKTQVVNLYIHAHALILAICIITGPPVFLTHPASHIVPVGMSVSLYCNISGNKVSFVWKTRTVGCKSWSRITNSNSYKYDVRSIQQTQQYICIASNNAGTYTSNVATIQVLSIAYSIL